jgi:hypothetical protein
MLGGSLRVYQHVYTSTGLQGYRLLNLELGASLGVTFPFILENYTNYIILTLCCVSINEGIIWEQ